MQPCCPGVIYTRVSLRAAEVGGVYLVSLAWWETQAYFAHYRYLVIYVTVVIYSLPEILATPSLSLPCI